jgi:hypothetical protein
MSQMTHLSSVCPRKRTPTELVDGVGEEDQYDSTDSGAVVDNTVCICRSLIDDANADEQCCHEQGRGPKRWSSTPALRDEENVGPASNEFLCAEEACDEEVLGAGSY